MGDLRGDFLPEPYQECKMCGLPYPITDLDENSHCEFCRVSEDEEDYSDE